jgi:hypothetical protein
MKLWRKDAEIARLRKELEFANGCLGASSHNEIEFGKAIDVLRDVLHEGRVAAASLLRERDELLQQLAASVTTEYHDGIVNEAQRRIHELEGQLAEAQRGDLCDRHYGDREDEQDHGVSTCIDCLRIALAEAQATIEKVRDWNEKHGTLTLGEILSAPSSTGGNDEQQHRA